jgi:hypothetical protein
MAMAMASVGNRHADDDEEAWVSAGLPPFTQRDTRPTTCCAHCGEEVSSADAGQDAYICIATGLPSCARCLLAAFSNTTRLRVDGDVILMDEDEEVTPLEDTHTSRGTGHRGGDITCPLCASSVQGRTLQQLWHHLTTRCSAIPWDRLHHHAPLSLPPPSSSSSSSS